jgi:hypothetical protein
VSRIVTFVFCVICIPFAAVSANLSSMIQLQATFLAQTFPLFVFGLYSKHVCKFSVGIGFIVGLCVGIPMVKVPGGILYGILFNLLTVIVVAGILWMCRRIREKNNAKNGSDSTKNSSAFLNFCCDYLYTPPPAHLDKVISFRLDAKEVRDIQAPATADVEAGTATKEASAEPTKDEPQISKDRPSEVTADTIQTGSGPESSASGPESSSAGENQIEGQHNMAPAEGTGATSGSPAVSTGDVDILVDGAKTTTGDLDIKANTSSKTSKDLTNPSLCPVHKFLHVRGTLQEPIHSPIFWLCTVIPWLAIPFYRNPEKDADGFPKETLISGSPKWAVEAVMVLLVAHVILAIVCQMSWDVDCMDNVSGGCSGSAGKGCGGGGCDGKNAEKEEGERKA